MMNARVGSAPAAAIMLGAGLLLLDLLLYLGFVAPRMVADWHLQGRALNGLEQLLAGSSTFCAAYGFVLIPAAAVFAAAGGMGMAACANGRSGDAEGR